MANREIVLRKVKRDRKQVCITYSIRQPSYKFTLETCDDLVATIKDNRGRLLDILTINNPTTIISEIGKYNICLEGNDMVGTLYAEWTSDTRPDECCEEMKKQVAQIKETIANLSDKDTVTTVKAGENVSVSKDGDEYTVSAVDTKPDVTKAYVDEKIAAIVDKDTITTVKAGTNVQVTKDGNDYTVSATDTVTTVKAGNNVQVSKNGNTYTVSATDTKPDVTKAYVDEQIAAITDSDTITTVSAGNNITVKKDGTNYEVAGYKTTLNTNAQTHSVSGTYTDTNGNTQTVALNFAEGFGIQNTAQSFVEPSVANPDGTITGGAAHGTASTTIYPPVIEAGDNITVTSSIDDSNYGAIKYTISATGGGEQTIDTNTITTITAGTGVSVTDNGTDGNHAYTIAGTYGFANPAEMLPSHVAVHNGNGGGWVLLAGEGINFNFVNSSGNGTKEVEISAKDTNTVTTVVAGDNITVSDSGTNGNHIYTITAEDAEEIDIRTSSRNLTITVTTE